MDPRLATALAAGRGAVRRADHPDLGSAIDSARRRNEVVTPIRGVYVASEEAERLGVRARALMLADPQAVIHGPAAAHLMGWPGVGEPGVLTASSTTVASREGFALDRRRVPSSLTRRLDGLVLTSRALTALDLVDVVGPQAIDDALRAGVRLDQLNAAVTLLPNRPGNGVRRELLRDSRDRPFSEAERAGHRALRERRVRGWIANHPVCLDRDTDAILDVAFRWLRLGLEIDGHAYHSSREAFVHDRLRDVRLAARGWQIVRFPASSVLADPAGFAASAEELIRTRRRQLAG